MRLAALRRRGLLTDVVIIVVAADDGVKLRLLKLFDLPGQLTLKLWWQCKIDKEAANPQLSKRLNGI